MTSHPSSEKERHIVTTQIDWQGIALSVSYEESYYGTDPEHDYAMAHLQILADGRQPLPITETGYKSHFLHPSFVTHAGGPVAYARAWLDAEAATEEWCRHTATKQQLSLF